MNSTPRLNLLSDPQPWSKHRSFPHDLSKWLTHTTSHNKCLVHVTKLWSSFVTEPDTLKHFIAGDFVALVLLSKTWNEWL